jgi:hypothetical protein
MVDEPPEVGSESQLQRNDGVNASERFLQSLCERSFLSLWSFPGLYRAPGKELCDLLVVCDRDCIVFSDKHCAFARTGDLQLDWSRWFRKAVASSTRQALRAVRWIREHPERIYLDPKCRKTFPLEVPSASTARFHVVVVAQGVSAACRDWLGGSGSLMINSDVRGLESHTMPFVVGDAAPDGPFVHVLDDTSLRVVLNTLDTITDFVGYLQQKERFLRGRRRIAAAGEEELLALYLKDVDDSGIHNFVFPEDVGDIVVDQGHWQLFQNHPQRLRQLDADRVSYAWDGLIEAFSRHAMAGTQYHAWPKGVASTERIVRFMAREPRLRRRILAHHLVDMLRSTPAHLRRIRVAGPSRVGDPHYVFVLTPYSDKHSYETNRVVRRNYLESCCLVTKLKYPEAEDIVGIATNSGRNAVGSEDAIYLDAREWSDEMKAQAERDHVELGILQSPTILKGSTPEYPDQ